MKTIDIFDVHEGSTMIRRLLHHKKVLLILDDVTDSDHLDYLAGKQEWFGSGSRVLITTRNEHLLIEHGVKRRFHVKPLNHDDALKLFSWKAFGKDHPEKNYIELSSCVVSYADGLPLALKVLGSFLRERHVSAWNSALGNLRGICNIVLGTLQISYDDLDDKEKKIFLDIACFFNEEKEDRVIEILDSCGFCAGIGIDVLIEKSLLTNSYGTLWMHQLVQEMGCEIVNRECLDEPGNRSRLWRHEETKHVLSKNTGTDAVESITMDKTGPVVHANAKSFSRMKKLRLLNPANVNLSNDLEYLSDNLRSLEWAGYPSKYFPSHFNPKNLLELNMCHSHIESFWTGVKERSPNCDHALKYPSFDYNYTHIITCKVDINGKELWKGISNQVELPSGTEWWQGKFGQITFSITARVGHGVIVKQCAARLVYEGDLEELDPRFSLRTRSNVSISEMNATTTAMRATTTGTTRVLILPPTASGLTMYFLDTLFRSTEYYRNEKLQ
ncbi:hypothetical protein L3X38_036934 [Prunus dulcis]|uniref:NB-ARC domain-containing protein n=1 Tax=Prunus dulcis TaxID=3755 RepID=A0AAD4YP20_PRUDU|nr:hypothetical protein L3X38_036934 [Prunus dulcis]